MFLNIFEVCEIVLLYMKNGENDMALAAWKDFKDYLEENRANYDEEGPMVTALQEWFSS